MPVVLAIEPDARQAAILKRVVRERARAEICVVGTKDAAIAAMGTHPPELILLTALLSPRDEEELVAHLRTLDGADHLQTLSIPLLAPASAGDEEGRGFLSKAFKGKKKKRGQNTVGCDPWTFAEEVAGYLKAAAETKADREWKAARQPADSQPADGPADPWPATHIATNEAPGMRELGIEAPEPPPLSDAAAFATAQEAPAPDTSAGPPVYDWPVVETAQPALEVALEPIVSATPERVVDEMLDPGIDQWTEPVLAAASVPTVETTPERAVEEILDPGVERWTEPILAAAPASMVETAPDPVFQSLIPERVAVADEPWATSPATEPEPAPDPLYLTSPDQVFEEVEPAAIVEPVNYRPLKRLPPLAAWARVEEPESVQAASQIELQPESDTAGVLARLRVPHHALAVSYPRRPHIRYVRAA